MGAARAVAHLELHEELLALVLVAGLTSNALVAAYASRITSSRAAFGLLLGDAVALTVALGLLGGASTPLGLAYLLPVVLAAVLLRSRGELASIIATVVAGLALVTQFHLPLQVDHHHPSSADHHGAGTHQAVTPETHLRLHTQGVFVVVTLVAVVVTFVVSRALRRREAALAEARREQQRSAELSALAAQAAAAAHELGTPLATIAVVTRELEQRLEADGTSPDVLEDVAVLRRQVDRCRGVLSDLSNHARAGREASTPVPVADLCAAAVADCREGARVTLALGDDSATTAPLPRRLVGQVLITLLDNALEADPTGTVTLAAAARDDELELTVRDRGTAPLPTFLQTHQLDGPRTTKADGMDIGLYVGQAILERLGGRLEVERQGDETVARLVLPMDGSPRPPPATAPTTAPA